MLEMAAAAAGGPIHWSDLGLREGIDLGFFTLRFYSLAYLAGILFGYWHLSRMLKAPGAPMAQAHADDLIFWCTLGIILGGRLGYATFYQPELWTDFDNPGPVTWGLARVWDGGMSFHGGLIGVTLALAFVSWRSRLPLIRVADYISVNVGFGMLLGRLANFINGELWGRPVQSDVPFAMIFPGAGPEPRHPSQLYQALGEGLLVMVVMFAVFWLSRARFRPGLLVGTFATTISLARFVVEFFREPDAHLAELALRTGLSMGQWLTLPLIAGGLLMILYALLRPMSASTIAASRPARDADNGAA